MSKRAKVRCTFVIDVDFLDTISDEGIEFMVEENGCPGTGMVGAALKKIIERGKANGTCWACALDGENELLSITLVDD